MKIGSHVSMAGSLLKASKEAKSYGANTFMVYTGAPQNTRRTPIEKLQIEEGHEYMALNGLSDIVVHAPYIINLGSYKENIYELATSFLRTELTRTQAIGSKYLVLHPGAYTDKDMEYGLNRIVEGLNIVLEDDDLEPIICLETMAGKGTEIGGKFEELAYIINNVKNNDKLGVCFDTCHVHDSGYDIVNDFEGVIKEFDEIVGLDRLHVMHINGSLNKMGAKKDRHANLGAEEDNPKGKDMIGFDAIYNIVHSKHLENKVFILETPWLDTKTNLYKEEIARLRADR